MRSTILGNALGELDRQLAELRDVRLQLEAEAAGSDYPGAAWEHPKDVLPYFLTRLYETILVLLEAAELPHTRERLLHAWQDFSQEQDGIGKTILQYDGDYLESKPLTHLETIVDSLRSRRVKASSKATRSSSRN